MNLIAQKEVMEDLVIQENSKLYFNETQLHKPLLTKGMYRFQLIFGISSIIFVFSLIFCFLKGILDFNIWYILLLAIDLGIYAMILVPYDEAKNYRFLFYDDRVEYKFDLINFSKHKNFVDSFIVIKDIKNIDN